jgi:hypothetical protein
VRSALLCIFGLTNCLTLAVAQNPNLNPTPNTTPRPREIEHRLPGDEPQRVQQPHPRHASDPVQLKLEADELAKLAIQIPIQIDRAEKGLIAKDLNEQLKRIEKISKRIRRELSQ